jgi:integrase
MTRGRQTYVQWFEPTKAWRFRRRVPDHLREIVGKREWTDTLPARSRAEAERLAIPLINETHRIIQLAEAGNWPPIAEAVIDSLALGWWRLFQLERSRQIPKPGGGVAWPDGRDRLDDIEPKMWALASEDDLSRSVSRFLAGPRKWRYPQAPDEIRDRTEAFLGDPKGSAQLVRNADAMARLMRQSRILHHQAAGGYLGESADRNQATWRILDMIEKLEIDPHQLIAAIKGRGNLPPTGASAAHLPVAATPLVPLPFADSEDGKPGLISIWAKESNPQAKTVYSWGRIMKKLTTFVGFDDVARLTAEQLIDWKDELVDKSNLHPNTIENHLYILKTLLNYAHRNKKIATNPAAEVVYRPKTDPRAKRVGYSDEQARRILDAARRETEPHLRWLPWLCALTGARLDEIAGADVRDVEKIGGVWVLAIRLDHRDENGSVKTKSSPRRVPLHPALIEEGFLKYLAGLPKTGPLFPSLGTDYFGKQGGIATKPVSRWLHDTVGIPKDRRIAPSHSWRHRFKSECRDAWLPDEVKNALLGHDDGSAAQDYGEFYIRTVLYEAITKIKSPFDKERSDEAAANPLQAA